MSWFVQTPKPLLPRIQCMGWFAPAPEPLPMRNECTGWFAPTLYLQASHGYIPKAHSCLILLRYTRG